MVMLLWMVRRCLSLWVMCCSYVRQVMQDYSPEAVRYLLLSTHYRKPLDWNENAIDTAMQKVSKLYDALRRYDGDAHTFSSRMNDYSEAQQALIKQVLQALHNDLNTPLALQGVRTILSALHKAPAAEKSLWTQALGVVSATNGTNGAFSC